jgi:hypothetical protein
MTSIRAKTQRATSNQNEDADDEHPGEDAAGDEQPDEEEDKSAADDETDEMIVGLEAFGPVRASQINTSVELSQRTVAQLFGGNSDDGEDGDLSQAAVPRAFDMSQSDFPVDQTQLDASESLQRMSESEPDQRAAVQEPPRRVLRPARAIQYCGRAGPQNSEHSDCC